MDPDPKDYITTMITLRGEVRKFSNRGGGFFLPWRVITPLITYIYLPVARAAPSLLKWTDFTICLWRRDNSSVPVCASQTYIKGTVSEISNDSTCIDCNFWFTMILLKVLSCEVCIRYQCLWFWKLIIFNYGFPIKVACAFLLRKLFKLDSDNVSSNSRAWNAQFTFIEKPQQKSVSKSKSMDILFTLDQTKL